MKIATVSPNVIFDFIQENPTEMYYVDASGNRCKLKRAKHYATIGMKCAGKCCDRVGSFFALEQWKDGSIHFDLFAIDDHSGDDVLMTLDHIHPKSKGGPNMVENYQPMCKPCNEIKSNNIETEQ